MNGDADTSRFWSALEAADRVAADAQWHALLARTAATPTTFSSCVCGSEYSAVDNTITLDADDLEVAAAAVGDYLGRSDSFGMGLVLAIASAVNRRRGQAAADAHRDWYDEHDACQFDCD